MRQAEPLCTNVGELRDFLAFLFLSAPDNFPAWRDLDLESAFQKLDRSVDICAAELGQPNRVAEIKTRIFEALAAYRGGNSASGAIMLQELMHSL